MDWMKVNCNSNSASQHYIPWKILFPFGVWAIWLHKNKLVFNPYLFLAHDKVVDTCVAKAYEFLVVSGTSSLPHPFHFVLVSWHIWPLGWVKLSTEGFSLGNPGLTRISNYKMPHIFREGNKCVDAMARLGGSLSLDFVLYSSSPDYIKDLLSFDLSLKPIFVLSSSLAKGSDLFLFYQKKE
ncbi:hypothetical protein SO802_005712 [Lithocarpus litseifolius]|uniref:RNase H type-1 domain-containing protein n=1 Tax=Lithocarpus litseifolius TaxID=425828 RepID=A0AAW2DK98_9ROSI